MDQTPIESILLETVPPATGENPGIQLTVSAPAAPAVHPNSREGRALRAAAKAAAAEMAGAV
jgi:hypothetical protein